MNEFNRLSKSTRVIVCIGFVVMLAYIVSSSMMANMIMEQRDSAYTQIEEYQKLIGLQNDKIQEQKDIIIKLRATQVSYHAPESYGIEHYANPITVEQGLAIIAEFRWIHVERLISIRKVETYGVVDETWERKVIERYDQLKELLQIQNLIFERRER